ncbi:MAG: nicotinate (nicotinamide) nucleotide adenylyltransferase [Phycisphaerales bacterium]|nr:nicotinate (nicotinamide) nucleotide adenylyltransferase [Phycisphaerales bacterium]
MAVPVLIFGGSFDPPTLAHRVLPMRAAELVGARQVIYIPAAISPHKLDQPPIDSAHRVAMLELAVSDAAEAVVNRMEVEREGPSYSIDTARALRESIDPGTPLRLLIGDDQAIPFHRWKDWDDIISIAEPLVLPRLHATPEAFAEALRRESAWTEDDISHWLDWRLDLPIMDVEATVIRNRLHDGQDASDVLAPAVLDYIRAHGLYTDGRA